MGTEFFFQAGLDALPTVYLTGRYHKACLGETAVFGNMGYADFFDRYLFGFQVGDCLLEVPAHILSGHTDTLDLLFPYNRLNPY